jgi:hypothetical protein
MALSGVSMISIAIHALRVIHAVVEGKYEMNGCKIVYVERAGV